jgi:hypothetical protein
MIKIWRFGAKPPASTPSKQAATSKITPAKKPASPSANKTKWYAVSVIPGKRCCLAAKQMARKRWLSADAPRLPLERCDLRTCECRYQHHTDRRGTPRRRVDREALPHPFDGQEKRVIKRERRRPVIDK